MMDDVEEHELASDDDDNDSPSIVKWWEAQTEDCEFEQFLWEPLAILMTMVPGSISTGNRWKLAKSTTQELLGLEQKLGVANPHTQQLLARQGQLQYRGPVAHDCVSRLCYDATRRRIYSTGVDGVLKTWRLAMGKSQGQGVEGSADFEQSHVEQPKTTGMSEFQQLSSIKIIDDERPLEMRTTTSHRRPSSAFCRSLTWNAVTQDLVFGMNDNSIWTQAMSSEDDDDDKDDDDEYDATKGSQPQLILEAHCGSVTAGEAHPFLELFGTVSDDPVFRLWCTRSRRSLAQVTLSTKATAVSFHPDGAQVLVGCQTGELVVLKLAGHLGDHHSDSSLARDSPVVRISIEWSKHLVKGPSNNSITSIKCSPNGKYAAIGARDNGIVVVELLGTHVRKLSSSIGHSSYITQLDWNVTSDVVMSNAADGEILYWGMPSGKQLTDKIQLRDEEWDTWTCVLGWPVQGIWSAHQQALGSTSTSGSPPLAKDSSSISTSTSSSVVALSLTDIASVCKTNGCQRSGQEYESLVTAEQNRLRLFHYPCLLPTSTGGGGASSSSHGSSSSKTSSSTVFPSSRVYGGHAHAIQSIRFSCVDSHVFSGSSFFLNSS